MQPASPSPPASPAQRARRRLQTWATLLVTLVFFIGSLVVIWQLLELHRKLSRRDGENMVWALAQAQNHGTSLLRDMELYRQGLLGKDALSMQEDVFHSRLSLLMDGPQRRTLDHFGQGQALAQTITQFDQAGDSLLDNPARDSAVSTALTQLLGVVALAGNDVMVREREEKSQQLDQLGGLINAAFIAISMVLVCGGLLLWQLIGAIRHQRQHLRTIGEQRDALQQTVLDLHKSQNATETYRNFVALVSHQFRTPLAVIDSTAQRLMRGARKAGGANAEQVLERMGETRNTVEGLTRLLDSVLTSVKLESGAIHLQAQPMNLAQLAGAVVASNAPLLQDRALRVDVAGEVPNYRCVGDAALLEHVLQNLLANACKYTLAASPLAVHLQYSATQLRCTVRDWGPGVAADELPFLFERFYRGTHSQATEGTGLGLYLARSIAQLHGGDLLADLPADGGLAVTLTLPAACADR